MESFKLPDHSSWRNLQSSDGTKLFCREWQSLAPARGTILLIPGCGEQTGRYLHVGDFFQQAGFNVLAIDVRGHGRSGGTPVYAERYENFLDDVRAAIGLVKVSPLIVFGHSFGGQLALALAARDEPNIAGYLVSGPWLALTSPPAAWLVKFAWLLNVLYPKCRFSTGIGPAQNSTDEAHLDSLADLDLNHGFITVRAFFEISEEGSRLLHTPRANAPVLIAHGQPDPVTSTQASQTFFRDLAAPAKELLIYRGFLHELHNEKGRLRVLEDYLRWIEENVLTGIHQRETPQQSKSTG
jgi:acylglycerol lipase